MLEVLVVLQECFRTKWHTRLVAATSAKLSGSLRMALSGPNILKVHLTRALEELMAVPAKQPFATFENYKANNGIARPCTSTSAIFIPEEETGCGFRDGWGHAIIGQRAYPKAAL